MEEKKLLQSLIQETEGFVSALPRRNPRHWESLTELVELYTHSLAAVLEDYPGKQVPSTASFTTRDAFIQKLRHIRETEQQADSLWWKVRQMKDCWLSYRDVAVYREKSQELVLVSSRRLLEIDGILADICRLKQSSDDATLQALAIPEKCEQLSRYERHINRTLSTALDRLMSIQERRENAGSMGSFGQING